MKKILIIDDDRMIVDSMSIVLKAHGYEVVAHYDEHDVTATVTRQKPDLIILDVMFPQDSSAGFNMARAIKSNEATAQIPIIMLSAINEKGLYSGTFSNRDRDESMLPVEEFLEKPVVPDVLIQKVKSALDRGARFK